MNYYEILGVGPDATEQVIKGAYRREAMKWHPDRHDGAAAKGEADRRFKELAVAYKTLRDPSARADYDRQLEQQLRHEYETRQQEQARQQRAQSEQAQREQTQQKQARPEQPGPDFEDTKTPFEDETASAEDANQMFFEQMLDLAFELAGRGFPEFNIYKALIALGCPEALAKAVAATAAKQSQQSASKSSGSSNADSGFNASIENTEPSKEDFYKAAIGPKNQDFFLKKFKRFDQADSAGFSWPSAGQFFAGVFWLFYRKMQLSAWVYLGFPFVLLFLIFMLFGSDVKEDSLPMTLYNIITGVAYWLFLPARMNAMYYNRVNKLILDARSKSEDRGVQLALLKQHGGTSSLFNSLISISIIIILSGILVAVTLPAYQDYTRKARVAEGIVAGMDAGKKIGDYYIQNKKGPTDLANAGFSLQPSETVKDIAFDSQTGVITITLHDSFFIAKSLLLVPTVIDGKVNWLCTSNGIESKYLPPACRASQAEADARLTAIKTESQAEDQAKREYAKSLSAIEQKYPELNPDSPSYNSKSLDWVAARKSIHQGRGQSPINALQLAVADYATAQQPPQYSSQKNSSTNTSNQDRVLSVEESVTVGMACNNFQLNGDISGYQNCMGTQTQRAKSAPAIPSMDHLSMNERITIGMACNNYQLIGDITAYQNCMHQNINQASR